VCYLRKDNPKWLKLHVWKKMYHANTNKKKATVVIVIAKYFPTKYITKYK
jgi:hypothetical protein